MRPGERCSRGQQGEHEALDPHRRSARPTAEHPGLARHPGRRDRRPRTRERLVDPARRDPPTGTDGPLPSVRQLCPGAKDTRHRWATSLLDLLPDDAPAGSEIWVADGAQVVPHDQIPKRTETPPPPESPVCDHCGKRIPQFPELPPSREARIRQMITERDNVAAMRELIDATGCPLSWADLWVAHKGRAQPRPPGTTCNHCGGRLRTPQAKQCLECGMDWHDPHNVHRRGT